MFLNFQVKVYIKFFVSNRVLWRETETVKEKNQRKKILTCPKCGFKFDVSYARVFACSGCPSVVSCSYVKCPKCGYEFPIR
ncbi:hypothetical protein DRO25_00050 [Candidatus Bathyarchaeota archaeon]|nr:MAG: hypothetical protein DRO25_00050 [Candidatus Bathyarchaeota archaeon]